MTVKEFVETYKIAAKPEEFIKKHIVKTYIPYEQKVITCENIVKASNSAVVDNVVIYKINTPAQFLIFTMTLISQYTDIDINKGNTEEFNILSENNLVNAIISSIPENEYETYTTILEMVKDDYFENNRSLGSYLDMFQTSISSLMKLSNNQE